MKLQCPCMYACMLYIYIISKLWEHVLSMFANLDITMFLSKIDCYWQLGKNLSTHISTKYISILMILIIGKIIMSLRMGQLLRINWLSKPIIIVPLQNIAKFHFLTYNEHTLLLDGLKTCIRLVNICPALAVSMETLELVGAGWPIETGDALSRRQ